MDRLTSKTSDGGYFIGGAGIQPEGEGYTGNAVEKLARFENLFDGIMARQAEITREMDELKLHGKSKTVRFKQLMAEKLMNVNIVVLFKSWIKLISTEQIKN